MASKYYYNRRKERWSSNLNNIDEGINATGAGDVFFPIKLCENPGQSADSVSQQFTVKNFEIQFQMESTSPAFFDTLALYIMYVPQGMTVTKDYAKYHPEYILGWKYFGGPDAVSNINRNPLVMKSRLSRKLNTGDQINLVIIGKHYSHIQGEPPNTVEVQDSIGIRGVVRWNAKAN